ncbi:pyridoxal-phosphate dependent enzyme [Algoriphagus confluentis]|uniref:Pyridoxal-phosphate dependent enzyme n=2 Tax=Algoriphagus confluentis TaxID=1697556 RepID=A0ABQ6PT69_9BACT|nr:pyridoxal-phosphate dependent enzyme [Algoriphagus confluentis]
MDYLHEPRIQPLFHDLLAEKKLELAILRLDEVHPLVSGNKFFKLKYNLQQAKKEGKSMILTFGGAFSNHIHATAAVSQIEGFKSIGVIRGEGTDSKNPTLAYAREKGMELHFVDRKTYREKNTYSVIEDLKQKFGDFYLIPEGGTNGLAIRGTSEILGEKTSSFTHVLTPIGTGGTFAGLAESLLPSQTLVGISVLKGEFIRKELEELMEQQEIRPQGQLQIETQFHFGGYAKWKPELIEFIQWFWQKFQIPLDPIYTGKMGYALWEKIKNDHFPSHSKILIIHTGGLQGSQGFTHRTGIELPYSFKVK